MSELPKPTDDIRSWLRIHGHYGKLVIAELDALEAERDALRKDKVRLDWLDHAPDDPLNDKEADWTRAAMNIVERTQSGGLRAAIDAAKGGDDE